MHAGIRPRTLLTALALAAVLTASPLCANVSETLDPLVIKEGRGGEMAR